MKKLLCAFLSLLLGVVAVSGINAREPQVLDIKRQGDPVLRQKSAEVKEFNQELSDLIDDMAKTLDKSGGVGIAAPQAGKSLRLFLVKYGGKTKEYVNPEITFEEGVQDSFEGCLSVPGLMGIVKRPRHIKGEAFDKNGQQYKFDVMGDEARIICHENDHLDGILFIDENRAVKTFTNKQLLWRVSAVGALVLSFIGAVVVLLCRYVLPLFF